MLLVTPSPRRDAYLRDTRGASQVHHRCIAGETWVRQGGIRGASQMHYVCVMGPSLVHHGYITSVSGGHRRCITGAQDMSLDTLPCRHEAETRQVSIPAGMRHATGRDATEVALGTHTCTHGTKLVGSCSVTAGLVIHSAWSAEYSRLLGTDGQCSAARRNGDDHCIMPHPWCALTFPPLTCPIP